MHDRILELQEKLKDGKTSLYHFPSLSEIKITKPNVAASNLTYIKNMKNAAYTNGHFVESISLLLQNIEFYLRIFINAKGGDLGDRDMFGKVIKKAKKLGFDRTLLEEIKAFNSLRIDVIHNLFTGEISHSELKPSYTPFLNLDKKVEDYIINSVGDLITDLSKFKAVGDLIIIRSSAMAEGEILIMTNTILAFAEIAALENLRLDKCTEIESLESQYTNKAREMSRYHQLVSEINDIGNKIDALWDIVNAA